MPPGPGRAVMRPAFGQLRSFSTLPHGVRHRVVGILQYTVWCVCDVWCGVVWCGIYCMKLPPHTLEVVFGCGVVGGGAGVVCLCVFRGGCYNCSASAAFGSFSVNTSETSPDKDTVRDYVKKIQRQAC